MHCSDVVGQWKAERQWRDSSSRKEQGVIEFAKMMEHQIQVNPTSNMVPCAIQNMKYAPYNKRRCRRVRGESWLAVRRCEAADRSRSID